VEWARPNSPPAQVRHNAQVLYREVARLATSLYKPCVLTCTRASGNLYTRQRFDSSLQFLRKRENAMAFVPAPNIIEAEIRYTLFGQKIENRIMVDNGAAVDAAALEAVAIQVWDWAETGLIGGLSTNLQLNAVVCTDLTTNEGPQFTYAPDATTTGGVAGAMLPNEVAFCISLHSTSRGRSARGRMFIPAIPVSATSDANNLSSVAAGALVSSVQTLINDLTTGTRIPVIVSYRHDNAPRSGGPVFFPIVSAAATDTLLDSQKRRKPGVGA